MTIRHLFTRPFMNYAGFSGRSGRPEFWLFILTFMVVTQGAELIGSGVAALAIPDKQEGTEFHRLEHGSLRHHNHDNEARVTFMIHRHNHSEGFHLHGMVNSKRGPIPRKMASGDHPTKNHRIMGNGTESTMITTGTKSSATPSG